MSVSNPAKPPKEDELRRLFGRFAGGERSDNSLGEGSGLGLSIVASIMRLHRGQAMAEVIPDGLRFRLVFPSGRDAATAPGP